MDHQCDVGSPTRRGGAWDISPPSVGGVGEIRFVWVPGPDPPLAAICPMGRISTRGVPSPSPNLGIPIPMPHQVVSVSVSVWEISVSGVIGMISVPQLGIICMGDLPVPVPIRWEILSHTGIHRSSRVRWEIQMGSIPDNGIKIIQMPPNEAVLRNEGAL
jgi:hypothetical protein